jgi:hypothetical protein
MEKVLPLFLYVRPLLKKTILSICKFTNTNQHKLINFLPHRMLIMNINVACSHS